MTVNQQGGKMGQLSVTDFLGIEVSQLKERNAELEKRIIVLESKPIPELPTYKIDALQSQIDNQLRLITTLEHKPLPEFPRGELESLQDQVDDLDFRSGLMSKSWWTRAYTAWGYVIFTQLAIGLAIFAILYLFGLLGSNF